MPAPEDAQTRVENILEKVDREVARRRARQGEDPAAAAPVDPPAPSEPAPDPDPAPAAEPSRPISLTDPDAPTPVTAQELASGLAAARRRLAIVNTQLDELAGEIETLNDQARRLREERLAHSGRPALSPAPVPVQPPTPLVEPSEVDETLAPERAASGTPAGMRVRPRPPAQSQRRLPAADQARLVAVELAVSGQTRGAVADVLHAQYAEVHSQAILDSLFGPGTSPAARMSGT